MTVQMTLLIIFISTLFVLTIVRLIQIKSSARKKNLQGLAILDELMSIVKLTQQHRGMHSGYLNGQTGIESKLITLEKKISTHYHSIQELNNQLQTRIHTTTHPEFIRWKQLLSTQNMDATTSFQMHSGLIARLLDRLWDMSDDFALTTNPNNKIQSLAHNLVRTLPELAEAIGQVRALTMQVSNSLRCTPDKKLHLLFTLSKIEDYLEKVKVDLSRNEIEQLQAFVDKVRESINDQSLSERNPDIFFQEATINIDSIFLFIQQGFDKIRGEITQKQT